MLKTKADQEKGLKTGQGSTKPRPASRQPVVRAPRPIQRHGYYCTKMGWYRRYACEKKGNQNHLVIPQCHKKRVIPQKKKETPFGICMAWTAMGHSRIALGPLKKKKGKSIGCCGGTHLVQPR